MSNMNAARRRVALLIAGLAAIAALLASGTAAVSTPLQPATPAPAAQDPPPDETEPDRTTKAVVIYVTQYGFEPADTQIPSGDHILMIRNNTDDPDLEVVVTGIGRVGADRAEATPGDPPGTGPVRMPFNKRRVVTTRGRFDRGEVRLSVPGRPNWACRIGVDR